MSALLKQMMLDSPTGLWPLDEGSGTTVRDASGNGHNGTYTSTTWGSFFGFGASVTDGAAGYATIPLDLSSYSAATVEVWFFRTAAWDNGGGALYEHANDTTGASIFSVPNSGVGSWRVGSFGNTNYDTSEFARPAIGVWHQAVQVVDLTVASGGTTKNIPYIDGVAVSYTKANTAAVTGGAFRNDSLYLGRMAPSQTGFGAFTLAYAAIYGGTLLSATRIKAHYQAGIRSAVKTSAWCYGT